MESSESTMQVNVERRPGSKVALTITVAPAFVEERLEALFRQAARRVTIPGFRPGKAPRRMLEERINRNALMQDAVENVIDITYKEALQQQNLEPLERGEIDDLKTEDDNTVIYTVVVSVRPEITLPEYKGLVVRHAATEVTDELVDAEIARLRERTADYAEVTDAGIENGDYVTVDYTMMLDGEEYPEGSTTGYPLEVGSDTFFPQLNEALLGVKRGETTTLEVAYPDDYSNKELAGKSASFTITVQQVRRRVEPEVTDDWAQLITGGQAKTVEELRNLIRENLVRMAERADRDHVRNELVRQVVQGATLEIPDTLVDEEYSHLMAELEHRLSHERLDLELYAQMTNRTVEDIEHEQQVLAKDVVRRSLVLGEIARHEGIVVTDDDLDAALAMESYTQGIIQPDQVKRNIRELRREYQKDGRLDNMAGRIFHQKVLAFLEQNAEITIEGREETPQAETGPEETTE